MKNKFLEHDGNKKPSFFYARVRLPRRSNGIHSARAILFGKDSPHWKGGQIKRFCLTCNKEFHVDLNVIKRGYGKFCSRRCTGKRIYGHKPLAPKKELYCIICNKKFYDYISRLLKDKTRGKCCSKECRIKYVQKVISGSNSYRWKGGITPKNTLERSQMKTINWSKIVKERDNYTCQKCHIRAHKGLGKTVYLNSHHIKSWKEYPLLRWDINNGITLCKKCHKELHAKRTRS